MQINPCTFYSSDPVSLFNRNIIIFTLIAYFTIFLLIKILHICKDHTKQKIESILNKKEKQVAFKLNIQNIENCQNGNNSELHLKKVDVNKAQLAEKQIEENQNCSSSSSSQNSRNEAGKNQQEIKVDNGISLKQLKMNEDEVICAVNYIIGHQSICLSFCLMYFPFFHVSVLCVLQFILVVIYLKARLCGKRISALIYVTFTINILLLGFGLLGLNSRVPNGQLTYCIDLII